MIFKYTLGNACINFLLQAEKPSQYFCHVRKGIRLHIHIGKTCLISSLRILTGCIDWFAAFVIRLWS